LDPAKKTGKGSLRREIHAREWGLAFEKTKKLALESALPGEKKNEKKSSKKNPPKPTMGPSPELDKRHII